MSAAGLPWTCRPRGGAGVLILGGGWVGAQLGLQQHSVDSVAVTVTNRSEDSVNATIDKGLHAVLWNLQEPTTWANLPEGTFSAVVITFALSWETDSTVLPELFRWLRDTGRISQQDACVIALSTTSVYALPETLNGTIDESSPLTGKGVTGKSMEDRIAAEDWLIANERATVLPLSGLVGPGREVSRIISRSKPDGLAGVNLVHVDDVSGIVRLLSDGRAGGQRVICSSGTYRYREVALALGLGPLVESVGGLTAKSTKRVLNLLLTARFLPAGYVFVPPVPSVVANVEATSEAPSC